MRQIRDQVKSLPNIRVTILAVCGVFFSCLGILIFGVGTALFTAWLVDESYSPVYFNDQWELVDTLTQSNGHLSLGQLWAQHNEHQIPLGKLASRIDLRFFGGRNVSLLIEIYLLQAAGGYLLIWFYRRYRERRGPEFLTAAGFFIFCMFYPLQIENFYWGFQVAFVCMPLGASLAFASLVVHADLVATRPSRWFSWPLVISLGGAVLAECSLVSGILVWPGTAALERGTSPF